TSSSPSRGVGSGASPYSIASGPPGCLMRIAFIRSRPPFGSSGKELEQQIRQGLGAIELHHVPRPLDAAQHRVRVERLALGVVREADVGIGAVDDQDRAGDAPAEGGELRLAEEQR